MTPSQDDEMREAALMAIAIVTASIKDDLNLETVMGDYQDRPGALEQLIGALIALAGQACTSIAEAMNVPPEEVLEIFRRNV